MKNALGQTLVKVATVTMANGKTMKFECHSNGVWYYGNNSSKMAPNFEAGIEQVVAAGGTVEYSEEYVWE